MTYRHHQIVFALVVCLATLFSGVSSEASPLLYVANYNNNSISTVSPTGMVSLFASGVAFPGELAFDTAGNLFVSNGAGNTTITKITPNGTATIFDTGIMGTGLALDTQGTLYVLSDGGTISKIDGHGTVTPFANNLGPNPQWLTFDPLGNLYVSNFGTDFHTGLNGTISKVTPSGVVSTFVTGLRGPEDTAFDDAGNLYVPLFLDGTILKIAPDGTRSTFASGLSGPDALAFDTNGDLFVSTVGNNTIDKITPTGQVSQFATGLSGPNGLVFAPVVASVPEPSAWLLLATGLWLLRLQAAARKLP